MYIVMPIASILQGSSCLGKYMHVLACDTSKTIRAALLLHCGFGWHQPKHTEVPGLSLPFERIFAGANSFKLLPREKGKVGGKR